MCSLDAISRGAGRRAAARNGRTIGGAEFIERLQTVRDALRAAGHDLTWELSAAASDASIRACEAATGRTLPDEFRAFLRTHDGASLSLDREPGLSHDITIFGTNDVVEEHRRFEALYRNVHRDGTSARHAAGGFWDGLIAFAHYGDGECLFDTGAAERGAVLDLDLEALEGTREHVIARSFNDWLSRMLASARNGRGLVYWLPADPESG